MAAREPALGTVAAAVAADAAALARRLGAAVVVDLTLDFEAAAAVVASIDMWAVSLVLSKIVSRASGVSVQAIRVNERTRCARMSAFLFDTEDTATAPRAIAIETLRAVL